MIDCRNPDNKTANPRGGVAYHFEAGEITTATSHQFRRLIAAVGGDDLESVCFVRTKHGCLTALVTFTTDGVSVRHMWRWLGGSNSEPHWRYYNG